MKMDILLGYIQGYKGICEDIVGYLDWISFLGYDLHSYPKSQKISFHILPYPFISLLILRYPRGRTPRAYMNHIRPYQTYIQGYVFCRKYKLVYARLWYITVYDGI